MPDQPPNQTLRALAADVIPPATLIALVLDIEDIGRAGMPDGDRVDAGAIHRTALALLHALIGTQETVRSLIVARRTRSEATAAAMGRAVANLTALENRHAS